MRNVIKMVALVATVKMICCKVTYDEILEQLREDEITLEQAQQLWLEHKEKENA
jgi:hypothetical protein